MGILICPLCCGELICDGSSLRCAAGHSYDMARSGYVNLHRPGIKSNARSGDPDDMVTARRAFLQRGHYDRYVREAAAIALGHCDAAPSCVIDAACGEGHHTMILAKALGASLTVGIDAAKKAADIASRCAQKSADERRAVRFIAGNIFDMPIADGSADVVTTLFAPIPFDEARRVLRAGGLLVVCSAGREHLIELRRAIYDEVRFKDKPIETPAGFSPAARENITYSAMLDSAALSELFAMTPFCRRVGEKAKEKVEALGQNEMTISVDCTVFKKL